MAIISFYCLKIIFGHFTRCNWTCLFEGFFGFFRGEMVQKWPIWGHHTQIHRFYGIKRWNTMRKKISNWLQT